MDHTIGSMEVHYISNSIYFLLPVWLCLPRLWTPAKSILIHSHPCFSLSLSLSYAVRMFFRHLLPCILLLLLMPHLPHSILGLRTWREEEVRSDLRRHEHKIAPAIPPSREVGAAEAATASKYAVSRRMVPQGPNPLHNR